MAAACPPLGALTAAARSPFLRALGQRRPALAAFAEHAAACWPRARPSKPVRPEASPALADALAAPARRRRLAGALPGRACAATRAWPRSSWSAPAPRGSSWRCPSTRRSPPTGSGAAACSKVERYTTAELEEHAADLAEAEALVAVETKAMLANLRAEAAAAGRQKRATSPAASPPPMPCSPWPWWPPSVAGCSRPWTKALSAHRGRPPSCHRAQRARSSPTTPTWRPGRPRPGRRAHRAEHGGQEHLDAPGRPDRPCWPRWAATCRPAAPTSASWTPSSPASAPWTTWPAAALPLW